MSRPNTTSRRHRIRRMGRNISIGGAVLSAAMLVTAIASIPGGNLTRDAVRAAPAGTPAVGPAAVVPPTGDGSTELELTPEPTPANCPGDTATDGYRWQTFISDVANDPATFTYTGNAGPAVPGGGSGFTAQLFDIFSTSIVAKNTAPDSGQIIGIPTVSLGVFEGALVDGRYNLGFACTLNGETASFWSSTIDVTAGAYTLVEGEDNTSTTTSTTVVDSTTTTTTVPDTTSTTIDDGSTTSTTISDGTGQGVTVDRSTLAPGETFTVTYDDCEENEAVSFSFENADETDTCTAGAALGIMRPQQVAVAAATAEFTAPTEPGTYEGTAIGSVTQETVTFSVTVTSSTATTAATSTATTLPTVTPPAFAGSSTGSPQSGSGGQLVATGSSTTPIVVWAVLLLVFGRMAILLGRKPKVLPPAGA